MLKTAFKVSAVTLALSGGMLTAHAGGLERSSQDFDILFEEGNIVEGGATFVAPQRKLKNVGGSQVGLATRGMNPQTGKPYETSVDEATSYWVPKISARFQLADDLACAAQYREPWGIETDVGMGTERMYTAIKQKISSRDYGLNCSYRFAVTDKSFVRVLGGVSYQELKGYQTRLLPQMQTPVGVLPFRIGTLDVEDEGFGWRLGAAYEIPEIALRTSVVYQSKVKYELSGTVSGVFPGPAAQVMGEVSTPQSVDIKFQTGIAPGWLALAGIKWTDWSSVERVSFVNTGPAYGGPAFPTGREVTALNLYYKDGWTLMGGIGHKFNDQWSGAATVTWDRATSTGLTSQTDVWLFGLGASYKPKENFEIRLAGALGWLGSGTLDDRVVNNTPSPTGSKADFSNDLVGGMTILAKVKF